MANEARVLSLRRDAFPLGVEGDRMFYEILSLVNGFNSYIDTLRTLGNTSETLISALETSVTNAAPIGTIVAFAGSTAPASWFLCNNDAKSRTTFASLFAVIGTTYGVGDGSTTFNLPDLRGIFIRGAETSAKLQKANSAYFSGTLGQYQNDSFQGHRHAAGDDTFFPSGGAGTWYNGTGSSWGTQGFIGAPITDGTNGVPRTGTETCPASLGLNYIIKYQ